MNNIHEEFEEWFTNKYPRYTGAVWKPILNRYTVMSEKQMCWETWNAAKGIPYKYIHGEGYDNNN